MFDEVVLSKKRIEELAKQKNMLSDLKDLGVDLKINGNVVSILSDNAVNMIAVRDMLIAFGRGFDYNTAKLLLDDNYELRVIKLSDYTHSKNRQYQIKARIIGTRGTIKKQISRLTSCFIKVYGKTVSIIGAYNNVEIAAEAIDKLSTGAKYSTVFKLLSNRLSNTYSS